ncbi:MAG: hypothetical protein E7559_10770 [Ruminococcaceae bacterium]|nr:hypothetical protein [Oscillospiraceae bacterium]
MGAVLFYVNQSILLFHRRVCYPPSEIAEAAVYHCRFS